MKEQLSLLTDGIIQGNRKAIARAITLVENRFEGYDTLLAELHVNAQIPVIGITGPPGAGKSTLISQLIQRLILQTNSKGIYNQVALIAVDPTSPFNHGALLGDRLRMPELFLHTGVYIRSLATRGALGGLSATAVEVTEVLKAAPFDYILIETVGVGQSEVEIASLADTTVVVLVPESGDEIQGIKSGIMEIGDIFVVNKSDRDESGRFYNMLLKTLHEREPVNGWSVPVIKTSALSGSGADELIQQLQKHHTHTGFKPASSIMAQRAFRIIQQRRMKDVHIADLEKLIQVDMQNPDFNLYRFALNY